MIKKSASKWLSLATITILGQPPSDDIKMALSYFLACKILVSFVRKLTISGNLTLIKLFLNFEQVLTRIFHKFA